MKSQVVHRIFSSFQSLAVMVFILTSASSVLYCGDKLGKIFIKAEQTDVGGRKYLDPMREDAAKELITEAKLGRSPFTLAATEADANYLMTVTKSEAQRISTEFEEKRIWVTISLKDGGSWKSVATFYGHLTHWLLTREFLIDYTGKWVKLNKLEIQN